MIAAAVLLQIVLNEAFGTIPTLAIAIHADLNRLGDSTATRL
jgi:hypothetical protein